MQTSDYITSLQTDKENLVSNLNEKGVEATNDETFTELVPKVLDIQSGGGSGDFEINECGYLFFSGYRMEIIDYLLPICKPTSAINMFAMLSSSSPEYDDLNLNGLDTSNTTIMMQMFYSSHCFISLDLTCLDTSKVKSMRGMISYCINLVNLNLNGLDASNVIDIANIFNADSQLTNLIFLENLGKGYIEKKRNYADYTLDLSPSSNLTHDSLMDVINKLYDLHLTYSGTVYTQQLILGDNKSKLTAAEIKIATDKGWTVS